MSLDRVVFSDQRNTKPQRGPRQPGLKSPHLAKRKSGLLIVRRGKFLACAQKFCARRSQAKSQALSLSEYPEAYSAGWIERLC